MTITKSQTIVLMLPEGESVHEYTVKKDSQCTLVVQSFNQKNISSKISVHLSGKNSSAVILGLIVAGEDANVQLHTMQYHEAPDTMSNLLVKTVLSGNAACSVEGGIRVELGAQKTNAYQRNENLILSPAAHATSKPSLEILADDVRCTHGATVGPLSEEELWYLETRGIPRSKGALLIISGFLKKGIDIIADEIVKKKVFQSVIEAL